MRLYEHITDGGAEYYSTTYNECGNGQREGTFNGTVLRTDGDELEIMDFDQLHAAGFKTLKLPNGRTLDLATGEDLGPFYDITSVARDDLEAKGFDTSDISDRTMQTLAKKMAEDYCEQLFWDHLETIADIIGIPRKPIED